MNVHDYFTVSTRTMIDVLSHVTDEALGTATANPERTGRQLLEHVFDVNGSAKASAASIDVTTGFDRDPMGPDLIASYRASAASTRAAFADPARQSAAMHTAMGAFPGHVVLTVTGLENLVHAWDLSVATRYVVEFDPVVVGYTFRALEDMPMVVSTFRAWGSWAPPVSPSGDASPTVRLLNLLGRDPHQYLDR